MGHRQHTVRRRTILAGIGGAAVGSGLGVAPAAGQQRQDAFVVEQGEECIPITPLSGDEPVETFYDWDLAHTDFSSLGTKDLQRADTSLLFLYRGPEDDLSLVIVHDEHVAFNRQPTTDGGSATFTISDLPDDGEWLVRDDDYDNSSNFDNWNTDAEPQQIDWTWGEARTDGGVFGHLGGDFEFSIDPAFDDSATLAGEHYEGQITDWEVLSGDVEEPERTALDLEESITIRTGTCEDGTDDDEDEEGFLGLGIVPDAVNPDSQGILPVDVDLPDGISIDDLVPESIQTVPGGVSPERIVPSAGGSDARLFFAVPALDLSGTDPATLTVEAQTVDGQPLTGEATVPLVPNAGGEDDDGGDDQSNGDDDENDDGGPGNGNGPDGDGPPGQDDGPPGQDDDGPPGPDGDGPPGQGGDDDDDDEGDDDDGGLFDDLFGDDDGDDDDGADDDDDEDDD